MYSDTIDDRAQGDTPMHHNLMASQGDKAGLAISFDSLQEELNTTAELVSNLFHRLDPILLRELDNEQKTPGMPESNGSQVQQTVWEKVQMASRINSMLRSLTARIDI